MENNNWKEIESVYIYIDGRWREVETSYIYDNGWKQADPTVYGS